MPQIPWVDRTFDFDFSADLYPELVERLRGTPARIEDRIRALPPAALARKPEQGWSIQENIGHLINVEGLFAGRLDDYFAGLDQLRPADMTNRSTHDAHYNDRPIEQILKALAGGVTIQDLLEDYPELEAEDIKAVLLYAAELVSEEQVFEVGV